jgi:hypothetical protein
MELLIIKLTEYVSDMEGSKHTYGITHYNCILDLHSDVKADWSYVI